MQLGRIMNSSAIKTYLECGWSSAHGDTFGKASSVTPLALRSKMRSFHYQQRQQACLFMLAWVAVLFVIVRSASLEEQHARLVEEVEKAFAPVFRLYDVSRLEQEGSPSDLSLIKGEAGIPAPPATVIDLLEHPSPVSGFRQKSLVASIQPHQSFEDTWRPRTVTPQRIIRFMQAANHASTTQETAVTDTEFFDMVRVALATELQPVLIALGLTAEGMPTENQILTLPSLLQLEPTLW